MDNLVFKLTVQDDGSAKISAFENKIRGLQQETITLSSRMKDAFNGVGNIIVDFAAKAGREFVKFSKDSVKAFLKFENAMVAVAKTTGIPKENLGKFSEQIRETAVNLKGLGKDAAVQIANIAEVAGQLGIASGKLAKGQFDAASEEILGFATTIAKAKIALPEFTGGVEQIATVIAKQIQLYGETPAAAEQYLSVMNKLSDTTAATAVDIAGFLKNFTIAPTLNILQEEAAAWAATFVSLGQNPYDAATRMQSAYAMILKGSKDVNASLDTLFLSNQKMADRLLEMTGKVRKFTEDGKQDITSYANLAREAIGVDANEAMKLLVTTLSEVESSSERSELAIKIFGQVGAKAILALIPELPKLSDAAKDAATVFLSTNEQALDSLAKMSGVSREKFGDVADFMKAVYAKDMPDAIRVLVTEINKIDDETEKARVASEVFGEDWEVKMNKAEGGVKKFDDSLLTAQKEIKATAEGASSIEKEYATALDKVGTSFSELTAIMDDIKMQWGAPLAKALSAGIELMIPVIDELRKNFMGVVEEFGRELGGEKLASAFRQTAEAFSGTIEEMGANAETFIAALKEQFTLPNLFATAMSQWSAFAVWLGDSAAGLAKSVASTLSGIGSGFTNEEYKAEMEDVFNPDQYLQTADAIKEVTAATQEKAIATQSDLDALVQLKNENLDVLRVNKELRAEYQAVASELGAAINSGITPTQDLIDRQEALRAKIADVGVEAYGNSTFPDMTAAMMTSQAQSQALTAEMAAMQAQIKGLGAEYEATDAQIQEKQKTVRNINEDIREQQKLFRKASDDEKEGIRNIIIALQNKKGEIQNEISDLQELSRDQKDARKAEEDALKESIQQIKEKIKANEELQKNTERTADLRRKQQEDEMKAANELYREQQKQAADSIKWISQLDDATKKRVLGEQDAVKVLQAQGVELTDLQAQEVRRMQAAYKTEAAYEAQAQALQAQMNPMGALIAAGEKLSGSLGGLSGGVGKIGGLFGIDTSGITDVISKIQGFSELPKVLSDIEESLSGIGEAFKSLKGFDLKSIFSGGGGISGLISSLSGIGSVAGVIKAAWKPIEDLFKNVFGEHKSKGRKATEAFQDFVRSNVEGGAQLAQAMGQARESMNFHDQFAQMTDYTYQLWNAFANTPIDGVNTGLQLLEKTMKAAGVPTEKLGQVAIQTFVGMQNAGYDAAEMSAKFAEMLNLTTEQADLLVQTLTGIAPPEAALQSLVFSTDASKQAFEALTATLTTVQANSTITQAQFETLSGSLQQVMADGQMTGVEIQNLATQMVNAGIPIDQVSTQLINVATSSGMTTTEVQALQAALAGSAEGGGETSTVFDAAAQSAQALTEQTKTLSGDLTTLTGQLTGAGAQGAIADNVFQQASGSAQALDSTTKTLSGDLTTLTGQLTGAGAETLATSNLFGIAGVSAQGLQGDVNALGGETEAAKTDLSELQRILAELPEEKRIQLILEQTGQVPQMAAGGTVGAMGLAVVNERGAEIAKFPNGNMALMTARGATLGAFPVGTQIIPHNRSMALLSHYPNLPRMATGGTVGAMGTVINVTITGNTISKDTDLKVLARQVSAEISRNYNARR